MELTKQNKLQQFVNREVYCNINEFVEYAIQKANEGYVDAPVGLEDFENLYRYPEFYSKYASFSGGNEKELKEEIERLESILFEEMDKEGGHDSDLSDEIDALKDLEEEPQEIFEYWLISPMLARDLEEMGEPIADIGGGKYVWGRTCTGQAIILDRVIERIYNNLQTV